MATFKPPKPPKSQRSSIAAAAAGLPVGILLIKLFDFDPVFAALLVGAVVVLLVSMDSFRAWMLLMAALLFSSYRYEAGAFTVRPHYLVLLALSGGYLLALLIGKKKLHKVPMLVPLLGLLFLNFISTALFSPVKPAGFRMVLILALNILIYAMTVTTLQQHRENLERAVKFFLLAGAAQGIYGIITFIGYYVGVNIGGLTEKGFGGFVRIKAGFQEADVLGIFISMLALMFIALLTSRDDVGIRKKYLIAGVVLSLVVSVLSLVRAGWIGLVLGIVVLLFLQKRTLDLINRKTVMFALAIAFLFVSFAALPIMKDLSRGAPDIILSRMSQIFDTSKGTSGGYRVRNQQVALAQWKQQPLLGQGIGGVDPGGSKSNPKYALMINSTLIQSLHDTGVVGLLLFVLVQIGILFVMIRGYLKTASAFLRSALAGFIAVHIAMMIVTAISSPSVSWLGLTWIFDGVAVAIAIVAPKAAEIEIA